MLTDIIHTASDDDRPQIFTNVEAPTTNRQDAVGNSDALQIAAIPESIITDTTHGISLAVIVDCAGDGDVAATVAIVAVPPFSCYRDSVFSIGIIIDTVIDKVIELDRLDISEVHPVVGILIGI